MAFKTKKLIVQDDTDSEDLPAYSNVNEVPGISVLLSRDDLYKDLLTFIGNNLDKPRLCMQAVDKMVPAKIVRELGETGDIITALHGYIIDQTLGTGKDGRTMIGRKYTDKNTINKVPQLYLIKHLSSYGQGYNYLSRHLYNNIKNHPSKRHGLIDMFSIKGDMHIRELNGNNELYVESTSDITIWKRHLSSICDMNCWLLKNLGCAFWDLGFVNGQNYMQNRKGQIKWVDYGGAGIVTLDRSQWPKNMDWSSPAIINKIKNKEMLESANSDFLMLQFLFHIDYWWCRWNNKPTNVHVWSSNIQIDKTVLAEIKKYMLPNVLQWEYSNKIYENFYRKDWTKPITWRKLRDFIV